MTASELNELGWMLRRGGPRWHKYLLCARELREATKNGGPSAWSLELALLFARALGLTKHPIPFGERCPTCPAPTGTIHSSMRTVLSLPDRFVAMCTRCGSSWVRVTEKHPLEPFKTR